MNSPYKILVLFAHPSLHKSRVNARMREAIVDLPRVVVNDLYENYPDFFIDVAREQELLRAADLIVFHHPIYWYSSPAILKEWQDRVLEYGFAYGQHGTALQGKDFMSAISTRGSTAAYSPAGYNHYTLDELLRPFQATVSLCGMNYRPPFWIQSTPSVETSQIDAHARAYRELLVAYTERGASIFATAR